MKISRAILLYACSLCLMGLTAVPAQTAPVGTMEEHAHASKPSSTSLILTLDGKATTLYAADVAAMPQKTVTVHNEHTKTDETYTGVLLGDLLANTACQSIGRPTTRC
jgi:hypothetical protein